jgi:hypothetical protein
LRRARAGAALVAALGARRSALAVASLRHGRPAGSRINDADNHFLEPEDMYERYIDPKHRDKAVRFVRDASGRRVQMYGDRPSKLAFTRESAPQTAEELERLAASAAPQSGDERQAKPGDGGARAPGMFLNRLNPYRGMSEENARALMEEFARSRRRGATATSARADGRAGDPRGDPVSGPRAEPRVRVRDDVDAIFANARAYNR